jgi:hypothetical protein
VQTAEKAKPAKLASRIFRRIFQSLAMSPQTPSRSMMVIGTAPDAARYSTAAFLFGDRASIDQR